MAIFASVLRGLVPMLRCEIGRWHTIARPIGGPAGFHAVASTFCERTHGLSGGGEYRDWLSFITIGSFYIGVKCWRDPLAAMSVAWNGIVRDMLEKNRVLAYVLCTHCLMALSPSAIREVDSVVEIFFRKKWNLPASFPKA